VGGRAEKALCGRADRLKGYRIAIREPLLHTPLQEPGGKRYADDKGQQAGEPQRQDDTQD
jgi:hypothetical protein